jgi:hypothetical protein
MGMDKPRRWCEISANVYGQLIVVFREVVDGREVQYGDYVSPVGPLHPAVERSYTERGPFGIGSIDRLRVVEACG